MSRHSRHFDPTRHPHYPAGAPDGRGGQWAQTASAAVDARAPRPPWENRSSRYKAEYQQEWVNSATARLAELGYHPSLVNPATMGGTLDDLYDMHAFVYDPGDYTADMVSAIEEMKPELTGGHRNARGVYRAAMDAPQGGGFKIIKAQQLLDYPDFADGQFRTQPPNGHAPELIEEIYRDPDPDADHPIEIQTSGDHVWTVEPGDDIEIAPGWTAQYYNPGIGYR